MKTSLNIKKETFYGLWKKVASFWHDKNIVIFLGIWIILAGIVLFFWYAYIYQYEWTAERKKEYLQENGQGITFNQVKYEKILKEMNERKETLEKRESFSIDDIFGL